MRKTMEIPEFINDSATRDEFEINHVTQEINDYVTTSSAVVIS